MALRKVSLTKYRQIERLLRDAIKALEERRREALDVCAYDTLGTDRWLDLRAVEIGNYCDARRWVSHYRNLLAGSAPVRFANQHSYAAEGPEA